jgi:hypothetical protein
VGLPTLVNGGGKVHLLHPGEQQRYAVGALNADLVHGFPPHCVGMRIPGGILHDSGEIGKNGKWWEHWRKVSDED